MLAPFKERMNLRGPDEQAGHLFSYVSPEARVPKDHPLRAIRQITDRVLATLSPKFTRMYAKIGRPSIPAEARTQPRSEDSSHLLPLTGFVFRATTNLRRVVHVRSYQWPTTYTGQLIPLS